MNGHVTVLHCKLFRHLPGDKAVLIMSIAKYYINLDCYFEYVKKSDSKNSFPSDFDDEVVFFYFVVLCYSAIGMVDMLQYSRETSW
jgi:hypothetical protein